jgi:ribosomal protein S27AE
MTLGNMRANGVNRLAVFCLNCPHGAVLDVADYPDDLPVPSFARRMVCTACGIVGAQVMPRWKDRPDRESLTGSRLR